jgi:hypothetical protein
LRKEAKFGIAFNNDREINFVPSDESAAIGHHKDGRTWLTGESRRDELERILEG